jgi:DNA polymerase-3 subunit delta'
MTLAPWLAPHWHTLADALATGRLHHALLLCGADGLGKRRLAQTLVAAVLCEARDADGLACGHCRACRLLAAGTHPDRVLVGFEEREPGKLRSEITVDQIRRLSERLALSSQFGGAQLALIDPADAMNASAANALLKTLEEPNPGTVLILVTARPWRLPATIRSRCQKLELVTPPRALAQDWLEGQGIDAATAARALDAALGNPGCALDWTRDDSLALHDACAAELAALRAGHSGAMALAERWAADRPAQRLWFAAAHAQDQARRLTGNAADLTESAQLSKLAAWFDQANRARLLLDTTVRSDLVLLELLRAWPGSSSGSGGE